MKTIKGACKKKIDSPFGKGGRGIFSRWQVEEIPPAPFFKGGEKGFALLDAILGLALLSAGIFGLLYVFQGSVSASILADQTVIATNLARKTMEEIIAQRDCNLSGCGYTSTLTSINNTLLYNQNPVTGFASYVITASAYEVNPNYISGGTDDFLSAQSGSGYARVTVTVSWNNAANAIQLVTLIANYVP